MSEAGYMEVNYDKFVFRAREDYLYHQDECWVKQEENGLVTVGITDYMQKTGGDVAFVELLEAGAEVSRAGKWAAWKPSRLP